MKNFDAVVEDVNLAVTLGRKLHGALGTILNCDMGNSDSFVINMNVKKNSFMVQHANEKIEPEPIPLRDFIAKGYDTNDVGVVSTESFGALNNVKFYIRYSKEVPFSGRETYDTYKIEFDLKSDKNVLSFEKTYPEREEN